MPMIRKKNYPPLGTASELLAFLAINGHLDNVEMPGWMPGTSVGELFDALKSLDDGYWMEDLYEGMGSQESADQWVLDFLSGEEVETRADWESEQNQDGEEGASGVSEVLAEYFARASDKTKQSFLKRMEATPDFTDAAQRNIEAISAFFGVCPVLDDAEYKKTLNAMPTKLDYSDPDLAMLITFYLDNAKETIELVDRMAGDPSIGFKNAMSRVEKLRALLKKKGGSATTRPVLKKSPVKSLAVKKSVKK